MLRIDRTLLNTIELHAVSSHPEECCGVLFGTKHSEETTVVSLLELANTAGENRTHRFLVTADEYRLAELEATRRQAEIVGFYHSHPDHPSRPSPFDLDHAFPWWSYVIVAVTKGHTNDVKSWVMKDDRSAFDEEKIETLSGVIPGPKR